jgi:hypothetical protein
MLVSACGGGSSGSLVDRGPETGGPLFAAQVSSGIVDSFGSVIVDGVEIEDATAQVVREGWDGEAVNAVVLRGQRVRILHDPDGKARRIAIDAAVTGQVSSVDAAAGTLTVAGQPVRTQTVSKGTRFEGGYSSLADVEVGDWAEIHGLPVYDASSAQYVVQATRIEQLAGETPVRVHGTITALDTAAKSFRFNGLTIRYGAAAEGGRVKPGIDALADGQPALVFGTTPAGEPQVLEAIALRLRGAAGDELVAEVKLALGGVVSGLDSTAGTFSLQGLTVQSGTAVVEPAGSVVGEGDYIKVKGTVNEDGSVSAEHINLVARAHSTELARITLIGEITDFTSVSSFLVRNVPVDASSLSGLSSLSCQGAPLGDGVRIRVTANQQAATPVVIATEVVCATGPGIPIRPLRGTVQSVDASARTLVLADPRHGAVEMVWNDRTTFVGITSADLASGVALRVESAQIEGRWVARVIRPDDRVARLDGDLFRKDEPLGIELHRAFPPTRPDNGSAALPPPPLDQAAALGWNDQKLGRIHDLRRGFRRGG